jgi:protein-disulfide isomerase
MSRLGRIGLALLLLALAPGMAASQAAVPPVTAADRVEGRADAPVTVIEYGSFACPHCANWHQMVYPLFKQRLIVTGRVRYVFRNLPTPPEEMSLPAAALARGAAPEKFFDGAATLMQGQAAVRFGGSLDDWWAPAVAASGRTRAQIEACAAKPATRAAIDADIEGARAAGVNSTPTFVVDGRIVRDGSLGGLEAAVAAAADR